MHAVESSIAVEDAGAFWLRACFKRVLDTIALRWPGDSQRESGRFARIDSQKNPYFHYV